MKHLFIGGIADGEWREIGPQVHEVDIDLRARVYNLQPGTVIDLSRPFASRQKYRAYSYGAGKFAFRVFVPVDWDAADVLAALIEGYRKPK